MPGGSLLLYIQIFIERICERYGIVSYTFVVAVGGYAMTRKPCSSRFSVLFACVLLAAGMTGDACLAQAAKLSLTTGALPPLTASPGHPGFVDELARAAFKRIGVEVEVMAVPVERSMINANSGIDDGDVFRAAGIERDYPNLLRVPEKVLDNEFVAYTKRTDISIRNWADLQPYVVAYATGWRIFDLNVKGVKEITTTSSIVDLLPLLEKGRADVILLDRWQGQRLIQQGGYRFRLEEPPLARIPMFIYLNKKHAALVPKLAQALADMKADGSYQKLFDLTLKPMGSR